jgi:hypothetical protein
MERIWILGGGRFGRLAAERLSRRKRPPELVIVDPDAERLAGLEGPGRECRTADGVEFVAARLAADAAPDWVVPALPLHLAAEWLRLRLGPDRLRRHPLSAEWINALPNPFVGESGDVYVSFADFLCPDDCPEPAGFCTATGKPREANLYDRLAELNRPDFPVHVLRSHQLAPGVGGLRPNELLGLLRRTSETPGLQAAATACRCHGVITALERVPAV